MVLRIRKIVFITLLFAFSCNKSENKRSYDYKNIKWEEFYLDVDKNDVEGLILLAIDSKGNKVDTLNQKILNHLKSDLFLEESNYVDREYTFWILDSLSQDFSVEINSDMDILHFKSQVFTKNKILSYKYKIYSYRDRIPASYEYININLETLDTIQFKSLIKQKLSSDFNKMLNIYTNENKTEIVENYKLELSQGRGDLLYSYQMVFEQPFYSSESITCLSDIDFFSHFEKEGIVFNVNVSDRNFLKEKEYNTIENYRSQITIPYPKVLPYLSKTNNLFDSIIKVK